MSQKVLLPKCYFINCKYLSYFTFLCSFVLTFLHFFFSITSDSKAEMTWVSVTIRRGYVTHLQNQVSVQERVNSADLDFLNPTYSKEKPVFRTGSWKIIS